MLAHSCCYNVILNILVNGPSSIKKQNFTHHAIIILYKLIYVNSVFLCTKLYYHAWYEN